MGPCYIDSGSHRWTCVDTRIPTYSLTCAEILQYIAKAERDPEVKVHEPRLIS